MKPWDLGLLVIPAAQPGVPRTSPECALPCESRARGLLTASRSSALPGGPGQLAQEHEGCLPLAHVAAYHPDPAALAWAHVPCPRPSTLPPTPSLPCVPCRDA